LTSRTHDQEVFRTAHYLPPRGFILRLNLTGQARGPLEVRDRATGVLDDELLDLAFAPAAAA